MVLAAAIAALASPGLALQPHPTVQLTDPVTSTYDAAIRVGQPGVQITSVRGELYASVDLTVRVEDRPDRLVRPDIRKRAAPKVGPQRLRLRATHHARLRTTSIDRQPKRFDLWIRGDNGDIVVFSPSGRAVEALGPQPIATNLEPGSQVRHRVAIPLRAFAGSRGVFPLQYELKPTL